ncbi:hypothetical protein Tco_1132775 [Tanacetum coccineum]|uniref:Integrase, catalytic region, zinc finger, CCHC-type, peptidase aspartic, catalytic n=1 Tax=Tanacetum coccineum TaxID=301880 RepID=A0ABQ5JGY5_9ASTR
MASLSDDIQSASFDTRPPMLDRYDFESWKQRIRLYCMGKDNGENILQSIDEGPFKMGKFRDTLVDNTPGPERDRVIKDLTPEEKERYKADIRAMNILLQGSELPKINVNHNYTMHLNTSIRTKEKPFTNTIFVTIVKLNIGLKTSNYDQLYAYLKQHESYVNENKMMLERYTQHTIDPLALVSNVSPQQFPTQSLAILPVSYQPKFANNTQLDLGLTPTDDLVENLIKIVALLTQSYKAHLPQTNNQLRTSSNTRNQATVQNDRVVVQNVQGGQDNNFDDDMDEPPTMFMENLSSIDPIYDEVGPSYDSDILSEVHDHDNYLDSVSEYHEVHEMHNDVQPNYIVDSDAEHTSDSNIIPYEQYVKDNAEQVVQSNVSSVPNDALMMIINDMHEQAA